MPCSSCGCYIDEPSWHSCEKKCIKWSETDHTWIAVLHDDTIVRCSWSHIDDSFWFFYCAACKRDTAIRCIRSAKIVAKKVTSRNTRTDCITDSSDDMETDDSSVTSISQAQKIKVTLRKTSGELWMETEPLPVNCTISFIVFDVVRVNRRGSVVPYLMYDNEVQPYWRSLMEFPAVRDGCESLEIAVVFQPIETPIAVLFNTIGPVNEDNTDMSFETFKTFITDPLDRRNMDMERLMNTVYPFDQIFGTRLSSRKTKLYALQCRCR